MLANGVEVLCPLVDPVANATILGGRTVIGHDSVIGSSVWVTSSIAPRTTVVLEKPRLRIRSEQPESFESDFQI